MTKLKPRAEEEPAVYVETERREVSITDITYEAIDMELLKKYFPSIYKDVKKDRKLVKRNKGSKG